MWVSSFSDSISLSRSYHFHVSCFLQISIHIFYMYDMSDHIQSKLIHLRWKIGTYQSHIKYIQGQIRLIHRLIHLVIILLNFRFQKCRNPNPRLEPVGGSKLEPGLLLRFQLSSQNILFGFIKFSFTKVSRPESQTRPGWPIQAGARFTLTFSIIFSKHVVWFYSILDFLFTRKHFILAIP